MTISLSGCTFTFKEILFKAGRFDAELTVERPLPTDPLVLLDYDANEPSFSFHIQAKSLSNVEAYRRALQNYYSKEIEWEKLLPRACRMAEQGYKDSPQDIEPLDTELSGGYENLVDIIWPKDEISCFFGLGEAAKSISVLGMCMAMGTGGRWAGHGTEYAKTLWLDYENPTPKKLALRMNRIMTGYTAGEDYQAGTIRWMPGRGIPLPEIMPQVLRAMTRLGATNLVVDSAAMACGGDATHQEIATATGNALTGLRHSVGLIAHTNRAEDDRQPFGSVFWHNIIHGKSWFLKRASEVESEEIGVGWYNRKVSDGKRPRDFGVSVTFAGEVGPIAFAASDLAWADELTSRIPLAQRVFDIIRMKAMSTTEIAGALGEDVQSVSKALRRHQDNGKVIGKAEGREMRWARETRVHNEDGQVSVLRTVK